jgi:hypothetical protein
MTSVREYPNHNRGPPKQHASAIISGHIFWYLQFDLEDLLNPVATAVLKSMQSICTGTSGTSHDFKIDSKACKCVLSADSCPATNSTSQDRAMAWHDIHHQLSFDREKCAPYKGLEPRN